MAVRDARTAQLAVLTHAALLLLLATRTVRAAHQHHHRLQLAQIKTSAKKNAPSPLNAQLDRQTVPEINATSAVNTLSVRPMLIALRPAASETTVTPSLALLVKTLMLALLARM